MGRSLSTATVNDFTSLVEAYQVSLQLVAQAHGNGENVDTLRKILTKAQLIENRLLSYKPANVSELLKKVKFLLEFAGSAVDENDLLLREALKQLEVDFGRLRLAIPAELALDSRKPKRKFGTAASGS